MLTVLDLFSGIGGISLGLERTGGFRTVAFCECEPYCQSVLRRHWPSVPVYGDIRTLKGGDVGKVDVVAGGDPCQANSNARRHGREPEALGGQFLRLVEEVRPRYVLRENPSTVRRDAPWPWWRFRAALERLGYQAVPIRFRACCAGADHRRDRLFVLATLPDADSARLEGHVGQVVEDTNEGRYHPDTTGPDRWYATPRVCRGADGIPHRVDRLRALGNAVVPQVVEAIGRALLAAEEGRNE